MAFLPNQAAGLLAGPCSCYVLLTETSSQGFLGFPENLRWSMVQEQVVLGRPRYDAHLCHLGSLFNSWRSLLKTGILLGLDIMCVKCLA